MGAQNIVTKEIYNKIKTDINTAIRSGKYTKLVTLDREVAGMHGYSSSTGKNIRRTKNYEEYCERVFRFHNHPRAARKTSPQQRSTLSKRTQSNGKEDGFGMILADWESDPVLIGPKKEKHEWLVILLITLFSLIMVEGAVIILFWGKYVQ